MELRIRAILEKKTYELPLEAYYIPIWEDQSSSSQIIVFEGYNADLKEIPATGLRMDNYTLTQQSGWVLGYRNFLKLPSKRFKDWDEFLRQTIGKFALEWSHTGRRIAYDGVDVVPDGIPGAGMVIIKNYPLFSIILAQGKNDATKRDKQHESWLLQNLGFEPSGIDADS